MPTSCWISIATCSATWPSQVPSATRFRKPAGRAFRAVMLLQARQQLLELLAEAADVARRALAEGPEIDPHPDTRAVGPEVRSVQNERLEKSDPVGHRCLGREDYRKSRSSGGQVTSPSALNSRHDEGLALLDVEPVAGRQHVEEGAGEAESGGGVGLGQALGHGPAAVDDEDLSGADDLDLARAVVDDRRVLVDPDAQLGGLERDRGQEPPEALSLREVLVDDQARNDAEARRQVDAVPPQLEPALAARDHRGRERRRAGGGPGERAAARRGSAWMAASAGAAGEDRDQARLVAAGHENAGRPLDDGEVRGKRGILAGHDRQRERLARRRSG